MDGPIIRFDVSKGYSHAQGFLSSAKPLGKTFRFEHNKGERVPEMYAVSLRNQHTHALSGFEDREVCHQKEKGRPLPKGRQDSRLDKAGLHHLFDDD